MITRRGFEAGLFSLAGATAMGVEKPAEAAPRAEHPPTPEIITVRFGTNRNQVGGIDLFGPSLRNPENGSDYITGEIDVHSSGGGPDVTWNVDRESLRLDSFVTSTTGNPLEPEAVQAATRSESADVAFILSRTFTNKSEASPDTRIRKLIFIPGYNNKFVDSIENFCKTFV